MTQLPSPDTVVPRRNPHSSFRRIADEGGLVVLPSKAEVKVLNPVAILIFPLLDGKHTYGQIIDRVVEEFDVTREQALTDIHEFVQALAEHAMLAEEGA